MRSRLFLNYFAVTFLLAFSLAGLLPALAADNDSSRLPPRLMTALDPVTLQGEGMRITLWGIKPAQTAETPIGLQALDLMDKLIAHAPVSCKIMSGAPPDVVARCTVHTNEDLGLELLGHGYVVVDRGQVLNSDFATAYQAAQNTARMRSNGIWQSVKSGDEEGPIPKEVEQFLKWGPVGALLLVVFVMNYRLKRMENFQQEEFERARRKESALMTRERHVLVSTLEGELTENKNRIEAFLTIYGDVLRDLKSTEELPKYQRAGDIIQKHPSLSKTVFEANLNKLSLLDMKLAGQLSKLYTALPKEQEYITLEPSLPLTTAVALVEKVLREAEAMMPPMDQAISALKEAEIKQAA